MNSSLSRWVLPWKTCFRLYSFHLCPVLLSHYVFINLRTFLLSQGPTNLSPDCDHQLSTGRLGAFTLCAASIAEASPHTIPPWPQDFGHALLLFCSLSHSRIFITHTHLCLEGSPWRNADHPPAITICLGKIKQLPPCPTLNDVCQLSLTRI